MNILSHMEDRFSETLYNRILATSRAKCPDKERALDIAQTVALKFLDKKKLKQTVDQAVIDALRSEGLLTKRGNRKDAMSPLNCMYVKAAETGIEKEDRNILFDLNFYLSDLTERQRVLFLLKHVWGFTHRELAFIFNVHESRVTQMFTEIESF